MVVYTLVHSFSSTPDCQDGSLDMEFELLSGKVETEGVLTDTVVEPEDGQIPLAEDAETELIHDFPLLL